MLIAALWCAYWFVHAWHYWEDDAWIHLEFARSLSRGEGFAFNGRVVAGDTAPLWVFLLTGMHLLIPDWLIAGKVLTILGAAVGISGIYAFSRSLQRSIRPLSDITFFPALMVLMLVTNPFTCYWIFSGMESVAAAGLACWIVLAATRTGASIGTFLVGCLLAGIAPLVRPEMSFLTALVALPLLGQWRTLPRPAPKALSFAVGLAFLCAPLALWSVYSLHAFGHLLPNTNAAKRAAPGESVPVHLVSIYGIGFPLVLAGAIGLAGYLVARPAGVARSVRSAIGSVLRPGSQYTRAALAMWIFVGWTLVATSFYIANHTYVQTRYILASAPGLSIVILALAFAASLRAGRIATAATLVAAIGVSLVIARPFVRNKGINCDAVRDLAMYIRTQLPPEAPVAVYSIGEIAFVSEHPIIDTGGITRPEAIAFMGPTEASIMRWAHSVGAQYYIGPRPQPDATLIYDAPQRFAAWTWHISKYDQRLPTEIWKYAPADQPKRQQP